MEEMGLVKLCPPPSHCKWGWEMKFPTILCFMLQICCQSTPITLQPLQVKYLKSYFVVFQEVHPNGTDFIFMLEHVWLECSYGL